MSEQKIRLLLFNLMTDADDSNLGFTTDWINALAPLCAYIDVVTMQSGRLTLADNVRVYSVGKEKGYSEIRRLLEFYWILFRLLRERSYDVCFAHMMPLFAAMASPLLKLWRVPLVLWYAHKSVSFKLRLAEKAAWRVVTASPESFRLPSRKIRVIGHGVDTDLFVPLSGQRLSQPPFRIVSVGRIAPVKGLEVLIDAVELLGEESKFKLKIIGEAAPIDMEYAKRLREQVITRNLDDQIAFAGAASHARVVGEYQATDVMVNTSRTGSIDKAVLEAMACGLPVITSNEAFQTMLSAWGDLLFIPPDAPEKLADSLRRLQKMSPQERADLGNNLRQLVVQEHSLRRLIGQLLAVFKTGEEALS
jgi:glycosyltransferase involved in cell wall biosynthesis